MYHPCISFLRKGVLLNHLPAAARTGGGEKSSKESRNQVHSRSVQLSPVAVLDPRFDAQVQSHCVVCYHCSTFSSALFMALLFLFFDLSPLSLVSYRPLESCLILANLILSCLISPCLWIYRKNTLCATEPRFQLVLASAFCSVSWPRWRNISRGRRNSSRSGEEVCGESILYLSKPHTKHILGKATQTVAKSLFEFCFLLRE